MPRRDVLETEVPIAQHRSSRRTRHGKKVSDGPSAVGNILCFLLTLTVTLVLVGLSYSNYTKKIAHDHIIRTKHLRKSAFHKQEIESTQQDDLVPEDSIYTIAYPVINHNGGILQLSEFAGRVALVINVASESDTTKVVYSDIKTFLKKYSHHKETETDPKDSINDRNNKRNDDLVIFAFPTNDFHQEQKTNEEIEIIVKELLGEEYDNPNFLLFHKSTLQHNPIFKALKTHLPDHEVKTNFYKYLIGRDGVPEGFYTDQQSLFDIEAAIKDELESS